jgi:D-xylose transport system substrate-binding protein
VKKLVLVLALAVLVTSAVLTTTALAKSKTKKASVDVCALLPDTKSSVRWQLFDEPLLKAAFSAAGVTASVLNAQGDPQQMKTDADSCITNGAKVILVTNLDSASGAAIETAAAAKGVKTIDYDRLTLGGKASYYVSFNNVTVGKIQGAGLVAAMKAKGLIGKGKKPIVAELAGSPTDNNATLFSQGAHLILDPLFKKGTIKKGPRQSVPQWDNQKALTIFEQMLTKTGNKIDAVLAANDGLGNAVVTALKSHKLKPKPVTGQDATPVGVQNILSGWQSMTVYKAVPVEAKAASDAAIAIIKGTKVATNGTTHDSTGNRDVPSVLAVPTLINRANYTKLFTDKFISKSEVCVGAYTKYCKTYKTPYPNKKGK